MEGAIATTTIPLHLLNHKKMKSPRQVTSERAEAWAKENLKKIKVNAGTYIGNNKCHEISRNSLTEHTNQNIVVTLSFVPKSGVNVHFIIKNQADKYVDNTLGYLSKYNTYYKIAEFSLNDLKAYDHPKGMEYLLMEFKFAFLGYGKHNGILFTTKEREKLRINLSHI